MKGLKKYFAKRNFGVTPEPKGRVSSSSGEAVYVIQEHHASHLHYDFRLEAEGTLKSWAVPKGPSLDPKVKRLAVEVEDHPLDYAQFEGDIPKGEYGGGNVIVWDYGTWVQPPKVSAALKKGRLEFELKGEKLKGKWSLIRLAGRGKKNNWLLFKRQDEFAVAGSDTLAELPGSVLSAVAKKKAVAKKTPKKKPGKSTSGSPAKSVAPPAFVKPQLAELVKTTPTGSDWIHEIKYDGYRTICRLQNGKATLLTRSGLDWSKKYPSIKKAIEALPAKNALLDGEVVWLNEDGHSDFQGLQTALMEENPERVAYYAFDLLHLNGQDLRELPLLQRKELLAKLLKTGKQSKLLYSEHWVGGGAGMYGEACRMHLEGIISKQANDSYTSGRSASWQKSKCAYRQEMVIGGYALSDKPDRPLKALLLGVYEGDQLRYSGKVGTGFTEESMRELVKLFKPLEITESAFDLESPRGKEIRWLKPKLVGEIEFRSWTGDQKVRQAAFKGMRLDKKTAEVHREEAKAVSSKEKSDANIKGLKITHPERVVYKMSKTTKLEVLRYYEAASGLMLPYMKDRPISVLRCQQNSTASCFFQKHSEGGSLGSVKSKSVHYQDKKGNALAISTKEDLLTAAQMGVLEFHAWGAHFASITKPDLIVFDLDPESPKLWGRVVEAAFEIRKMLQKLGLESYVNVTGGKGLHVRVPIAPLYSWDQVKEFSKSLMRVLEDGEPAHFTTNMAMSKRKGRIFLDYLRNGYGATAALPYSLRARELPSVVMPITWKELKVSLSPSEFQLPAVLALLKKRKDPWAGMLNKRQRIALLEGGKSR